MRKYEMKDLPIAQMTKAGLFENGKVTLKEEDLRLLLDGGFTSIQKIQGLKENGKEKEIQAKVRLIQSNNEVKLGFAPVAKTLLMHDHLLSPEEKEELRKGKILTKEIKASGTLVASGVAPYKDIEGNTKSFFITLENENGKVKTIWGKELEKALKESNKQVGDKISLAYMGKTAVMIEPKQLLELEGRTVALNSIEELQRYLNAKIKEETAVKINGSEVILSKDDVNTLDWFASRFSDVFNQETKAERNSWKVETYYPVDEVLAHLRSKKGTNQDSKEDEEIVLEYDNDTENFVGVSLDDVPYLESVNGIELSQAQSADFRRGKKVKLPDNTEIAFSPIKGFRTNRSALIVSVLIDGGISFVLFQMLRAGANKIILQAKENEKFKEGYLLAIENHKKSLAIKLENDPLNKGLRKEMALLNNEIKRHKSSEDLLSISNVNEKAKVNVILTPTEIADLKKMIEVGRPIDLDIYKEQLELVPDVIDGVELSELDKLNLVTGKLLVDGGLSYTLDEEGAIKRNLEGVEDFVKKSNIAVLEKIVDNLAVDATLIENVARIKMQLDYLGFSDKDLQDKIEEKIKEKKDFSTTYTLEKEGVPMSVNLNFKENEGKLKWANFEIKNEVTNRTQQFLPYRLWSIDAASKLINGEVVKAKFTKNEIEQDVDVKLDFDRKIEGGYAMVEQSSESKINNNLSEEEEEETQKTQIKM